MRPHLLLNLRWPREEGLVKVTEEWTLPVERDHGVSLFLYYLYRSSSSAFLSSFLYFTLSQAVTHRFKVTLCFFAVPLGLCESCEVWWYWRSQQLISWRNLCEIFQCLYSSPAQQVLWQPLNQQVFQHEKACGSLTFLTVRLTNHIFSPFLTFLFIFS